MANTITQIDIPGVSKLKSGKVRDIFDLGDSLLFAATDRISAFDVILPNPIPEKGRVLTALSEFWFGKTRHIVENHFVTSDFDKITAAVHLSRFLHRDGRRRDPTPGSGAGLGRDAPAPIPTSGSPTRPQGDRRDCAPRSGTATPDLEALHGRSMLVRKCRPLPVECVVRGYLAGSGLKEYMQSGTICGIKLPERLLESSQFPHPVFTPATKAETGHDENISFDQCSSILGKPLAEKVRDISLALYSYARDYAATRGIIIADTKFEFGLDGDRPLLIDEALTPDSSRFWPADSYTPGKPQLSFDKQFVRDYLETLDWDKTPPGPVLPDEVIRKTTEKYLEALKRLTA